MKLSSLVLLCQILVIPAGIAGILTPGIVGACQLWHWRPNLVPPFGYSCGHDGFLISDKADLLGESFSLKRAVGMCCRPFVPSQVEA